MIRCYFDNIFYEPSVLPESPPDISPGMSTDTVFGYKEYDIIGPGGGLTSFAKNGV